MLPTHRPFVVRRASGRRSVETGGGGNGEKKTIIRLPLLMAPGSTRHAATTLRWLLSHGHRPRLSNKRTGVFLFLFDVRVFTTIPATRPFHDLRPTMVGSQSIVWTRAQRVREKKILIYPCLGCYRPPDRPKPPPGQGRDVERTSRIGIPRFPIDRYSLIANYVDEKCTVKQPNRPTAFSL